MVTTFLTIAVRTQGSKRQKSTLAKVRFKKGICGKVLGSSQDLWEVSMKNLGNRQESRLHPRNSLIRMLLLPPLDASLQHFPCIMDTTNSPTTMTRLDITATAAIG